MSARSRSGRRRFEGPRADDARVLRSRAAVVDAARTLFLSQGYAGTTMEDIALLAGRTKRTLYNNYADKDALFTQIVMDVILYAEQFAQRLGEQFAVGITAANLHDVLDEVACRLAIAVVRKDVVALRRLLVSEARTFPALARRYFNRAPGRVIDALAVEFETLSGSGLLDVVDARRAGSQFAYLAVGESLDRAVLTGTIPRRSEIVACARDGVATFMARYGG